MRFFFIQLSRTAILDSIAVYFHLRFVLGCKLLLSLKSEPFVSLLLYRLVIVFFEKMCIELSGPFTTQSPDI